MLNKSGISRRQFLLTSSAAMAGLSMAQEHATVAPIGVPLKLEPLPFEFDALEPYLDAATLKLHHDNHHAEVLRHLQCILDRSNLQVGSVTSLMPMIRSVVLPCDPRRRVVKMGGPPETLSAQDQKALRLYGGAHVNHTAFWRFLTPPGTGPKGPEGRVAAAIAREFGSVDEFKSAFAAAAVNHFGSGWAFLVCQPDGKLVITTLKGEDNPLMTEFVKPAHQGRFILCLDLWEHAYYARYQNDRKKYIDAWWNVVNWNFVARGYALATPTLSA